MSQRAEAAQTLGISMRRADRLEAFARARLQRKWTDRAADLPS
jgi:hypothetical protein